MRGVAILSILVTAGCAAPGGMPHAVTTDAEEYAVYRAVLGTVYGDAPLMVDERTHPHVFRLEDDVFAGVEPELVDDFRARLDQTRLLRAEGFAPRAGVCVAPGSLLDPLEELRRRDANAWGDTLRARLGLVPGERWLVSLSRVGFNRERTRALVSVYDFCGILCAEANLLLLEKRGGEWVEARRLYTLFS